MTSLEANLEQLINEAVGKYDLDMEKLSFMAKASLPIHPKLLNNFGLINQSSIGGKEKAFKKMKFTQIKRACCLGLENVSVRVSDPSCVGKTEGGCENEGYRSIIMNINKKLCKNIDNWEVMNKIRNNPNLKEELKSQLEPEHIYEPSTANTINQRCDTFMNLYCTTLRDIHPDNDNLALSSAIMNGKRMVGAQECACLNSKIPELLGSTVPTHCVDSACGQTGVYRMGSMFGNCNVTICQQNIDLSQIDAKQISILNNSFSNQCGNRDLNSEKAAADAVTEAKRLKSIAQQYLEQTKPLLERAGNEFAAGNYLALETYRDSIKISVENINNEVGAKMEPLLAKASSDNSMKAIVDEVKAIYNEALRNQNTVQSYVSQGKIIVKKQEEAARAEAQRKAAEEAAAKAAKQAADARSAQEAAAAEEARKRAEAELAAAAEAKRQAQLAEAEAKAAADKKRQEEELKLAVEKAKVEAELKAQQEATAKAEAEANQKIMIYAIVGVIVLGAVGGGAYLALRKKN